jgi:hypothetical protein
MNIPAPLAAVRWGYRPTLETLTVRDYGGWSGRNLGRERLLLSVRTYFSAPNFSADNSDDSRDYGRKMVGRKMKGKTLWLNFCQLRRAR